MILAVVVMIILGVAVWYDTIKGKKGCTGNCQQGRMPCDCGRNDYWEK